MLNTFSQWSVLTNNYIKKLPNLDLNTKGLLLTNNYIKKLPNLDLNTKGLCGFKLVFLPL